MSYSHFPLALVEGLLSLHPTRLLARLSSSWLLYTTFKCTSILHTCTLYHAMLVSPFQYADGLPACDCDCQTEHSKAWHISQTLASSAETCSTDWIITVNNTWAPRKKAFFFLQNITLGSKYSSHRSLKSASCNFRGNSWGAASVRKPM